MKNGIAESFLPRMARVGTLILVAAAVGAPAFVKGTPLGRAELTGRLCR